jgi:hypothetical protein
VPGKPENLPSAVTVAAVVAMTAVVTVALWATGLTQPLAGRLPDTDDYMRLVQVRDWLAGAGWYDTVQHRLAPPAGVDMHWSRLADLPVAALAVPLDPFFGSDVALLIAAAIVPSLWLLAYFAVQIWGVARLPIGVPAPIVLLASGLALPALVKFMPGQVDYHAMVVVLVLVALRSLDLALAAGPAGRRATISGMTFAVALAVGIEALPFAAGAILWLALMWIARGRPALRLALPFAAALAAGSTLLLILGRPAAHLFVTACDALSLPYVAGTLLNLLVWLFAAAVRPVTPAGRVLLLAGAGAAAVALLLVAFPDCQGGPYAQVDARVLDMWMSQVAEAFNLARFFTTAPWGTAATYSLPALLGCAGVLAALWRCGDNARWFWLLRTISLAAAVLIMMWKIRGGPMAAALAVLPWSWVIAHLRQAIGGGRPLRRALATIIALLGPMLVTVGLSAASTAPAADRSTGERCRLDRPVAAAIAASPAEGGGPGLVAAPIDFGPALLLFTPHAVLAAPYHRNTEGLLTAHDLFSATDAGEAERLAAARGITHVLVCGGAPEMRLYDADRSLMHALVRTDRPPAWLEPVPLPPGTGLRLFRVREIPAAG